MANFYSVPVTAENFANAWLSVDSLRVRAIKRRISCILSLWAGGIGLLSLLVIGLCGLFYEYGIRPFYDLIRLLPDFENIWSAMDWLLVRGPGGAVGDFLTLLLILYWITIGLMALFYGIAQLFCHPKSRPVPEESARDNAAALLANARETMEIASDIHPRGWFAFPFAFFLIQLAFLIACILLSGDPAPLLKRHLTPSTALNYMLVFLGTTGGFATVYGLLVYALWCFCRMKLPYSFVADIECYSLFAEEKAGKLSYPELLEKRKEKAAKTCQSALAAEKSGAYGKAAALFLEAAHGGDVSAMEHYARHCLISDSPVPAEYWLRRCVATGSASKNAKKMLRRLRMGANTGAAYIRDPVQ